MAISVSHLARLLAFKPDDADKRLRTPYLLWEAPPETATDTGHWERTDGGASNRPRTGEATLLAVEKLQHPNNPFAMGITVGRIDSNDIVIDDESISRFHAFFQFDERKKLWILVDAESRNGSLINGRKLTLNEKGIVSDEAHLQFGSAKLRFLSIDALRLFLEPTVKLLKS
jgi:FHA domain